MIKIARIVVFLTLAHCLTANAIYAPRFGESIATHGDLLLVGAQGANDFDGAAFLYQLKKGKYELIQKIEPTVKNGRFGNAVAINDKFVVIGQWDVTLKYKNQGAVYVYKISDLTAGKVKPTRLLPPKGETRTFGFRIQMIEETLAISANRYQEEGTVFVYRLEGEEWKFESSLQSSIPFDSNEALYHHFGDLIALEKSFLVVGAVHTSIKFANTGAAFLFSKDQNGKFKPKSVVLSRSSPRYNDRFGGRAAVTNDLIAIAAMGVKVKKELTGAVYVFKRDASGEFPQTPTATLQKDTVLYDDFGNSVLIWRKWILVGANRRNSKTGGVYVFTPNKELTKWTQSAIIEGSSPKAFSGVAIAKSGNRIFIGETHVSLFGEAAKRKDRKGGSVAVYEIKDPKTLKFERVALIHYPDN